MLAGLVITARSDGRVDVGPISDPVTDLVAEWLERLLIANAALARVVSARLTAAPERDGCRAVRVAGLRGLLELTAEHGAPPHFTEVVA